MKVVTALIAFILLFWVLNFNNPASFAATQSLSLTNLPVSVDQSQQFEVGITFSCPGCTTDSFLRGVFYPSGSSYFGYTQDNSGNWSNAAGGSCNSYFKIAQADLSKDGSWSGTLKFKPDKDSVYYSGPGEYLFKVGRYTPSCGSPLYSTESTIAITGPSPTPTSAPTSTTVPTVTSIPTSSKTPTPKPTSVTPANKLSDTPPPEISSSQKEVLGETSSDIPTKAQAKEVKSASSNTGNAVGTVFIVLGVISLILCGIVALWPYKEVIISKFKR